MKINIYLFADVIWRSCNRNWCRKANSDNQFWKVAQVWHPYYCNRMYSIQVTVLAVLECCWSETVTIYFAIGILDRGEIRIYTHPVAPWSNQKMDQEKIFSPLNKHHILYLLYYYSLQTWLNYQIQNNLVINCLQISWEDWCKFAWGTLYSGCGWCWFINFLTGKIVLISMLINGLLKFKDTSHNFWIWMVFWSYMTDIIPNLCYFILGESKKACSCWWWLYRNGSCCSCCGLETWYNCEFS